MRQRGKRKKAVRREAKERHIEEGVTNVPIWQGGGGFLACQKRRLRREKEKNQKMNDDRGGGGGKIAHANLQEGENKPYCHTA